MSKQTTNNRISQCDPHWGIVAGDFVETGGMDVANLHLAGYLAEQGGVELITHRADESLISNPHVKVTRIPRPFGKHLLGQIGLHRAARAAAAALRSCSGRFIANGGNCDAGDINWVHYVHAAHQPAEQTNLARKIKSAYNHRSSLTAERQSITRAKYVVCNSQVTARHVIELLGTDEARVSVVYYGADPQRFPLRGEGSQQAARLELAWEDRPWAVFVGALGDRRKGFDTLYQAWRLLARDRTWDVALAVVGTGAELPQWRKRIAADGLSDSIHLLGFRSDVPVILSASDVLVHPARYEAYGLGVHEALCMGLPVIPTVNCGVSERIGAELEDLVLPPAVTPEQLAKRLQYWRNNLESWPAKTTATTQRLRDYTWRDMAAEFTTQVQEDRPCPVSC